MRKSEGHVEKGSKEIEIKREIRDRKKRKEKKEQNKKARSKAR